MDAKPKSKIIYLKQDGTNPTDQRRKAASKIRDKGFSVDDFSTVVCVNGKSVECGGFPTMLNEMEAIELLEPFRAQEYSRDSDLSKPPKIRIDVVYLSTEQS